MYTIDRPQNDTPASYTQSSVSRPTLTAPLQSKESHGRASSKFQEVFHDEHFKRLHVAHNVTRRRLLTMACHRHLYGKTVPHPIDQVVRHGRKCDRRDCYNSSQSRVCLCRKSSQWFLSRNATLSCYMSAT